MEASQRRRYRRNLSSPRSTSHVQILLSMSHILAQVTTFAVAQEANDATAPASQPTSNHVPESQPAPEMSSVPTASTIAPTSRPTIDPIVAESVTWASIRVTAMVSALTMLALISLYEFGRRSPKLRDIFDRKRETRPGRTPPKLLSGSGPLEMIYYMGEYIFVDGYVYKEYAKYARWRQEEDEARQQKQETVPAKGDTSRADPDSFVWPSTISPPATNDRGSLENMSESELEEGQGQSKATAATAKHFFPDDDVDSNENGCEEEKEEMRVEADSLMTGTFASPASSEKSLGFQAAREDNPEEAAFQQEDEKEDIIGNGGDSIEKVSDISETERACSNLTSKALPMQQLLPSTSSRRVTAISHPSRWRYFFVRPGARFGSLSSYRKRKAHGSLSPRHLRELANWRESTTGNGMSVDESESWYQKALRYVPILLPLEPTETDRELLRCIGLDSYVMIRFLRFGFETQFWSFVAACIVLIPTYYTNDYDGEFYKDETGGFSTTTTTGYFRITINRLENDSPKIWVVWAFAIVYFLAILRRLWVEWVVFVDLREDFLANGDPDATKEDDPESLKQFRNSCVIEYVPRSHRRDKDLFLFYESLFPGQVRRAEMVVNSARLTTLIQERRRYIAEYERINAKQVHEMREYCRLTESLEREEPGHSSGCIRRKPVEPVAIKIRVGGGKCCSGGSGKGELVEALPYYMSEIRRMNKLVDEEYKKIVRRKEDEERESVLGSLPEMSRPGSKRPQSYRKHGHMEKYLTKIFLPHDDSSSGFHADCGNGFVEFSTRAAKQAALQCNLTGQASYFSTEQAPDPRDLIWANLPSERRSIRRAYVLVQGLLFVGVLFWSALVGLIGNIETAVVNSGIDVSQNLLSFIAGYLPVLILVILMATIPSIFTVLAKRVIRFRSHSESDKFVLKWNVLYRIANFCVILISGTLYNAILSVRENPEEVVQSVANGVLVQSQFFLNVVLTAIGTGTSLQISQLWTVLYWLIVKNIITEEAMSERKLEQLKVPKEFIFGRFTAEFIYVFMIAVVYSPIVPLITGACAAYFFFASKIYTHQALFVFSQRYEGGGKLFYSVNRTVFVIIYVSIVLFGTILILKGQPYASGSFLVLMLSVTYIVDREIHEKFSSTSQKLPLTTSRIMDEEYAGLLANEETASEIRSRRTEVSQLSDTDSVVGVDRRKLFSTTRSKTLRNLSTSVGMGVGLPNLIRSKGKRALSERDLDFYLYRQPDLHKETWETEPRPYRLDE